MTKNVDSKHREYQRYSLVWEKCRDTVEGVEAIRDAGQKYLPALSGQSDEEYRGYKTRGVFYEATSRTVSALVGAIFQKDPLFEPTSGDEKKMDEFFKTILPKDITIIAFMRNLVREVVTVGRVGVLVDVGGANSATKNDPYLVTYMAEDIINWHSSMVSGREEVDMVVLREVEYRIEEFQEVEEERFRVLKLEDNKYIQELYKKVEGGKANQQEQFEMVQGYPITPRKNGKTLDFIPFQVINNYDLSVNCFKPPLTGMVDYNIGHWRNSVDLEHGLHYVAVPTPWVAGFPQEDTILKLGANVAWVSENPQANAGFLEFTGQGLQAIESAMKEKQDIMAVLGVRMLEAPKIASESAENQQLKRSGESSVLSTIAENVSEGATRICRYAADWMGNSDYEKNLRIELQKEYLQVNPDSQLLQSLMGMVQSGQMSFTTLFYNLQKMGLIPTGTNQSDEEELIQNSDLGLSLPPEEEEEDDPEEGEEEPEEGDEGDGNKPPPPKKPAK